MSARPLGFLTATALVVGSMIGSGAFLLPAALAPFGAASLTGWAITLAGAMLLALTFARLAMRWPRTGGPYVYARNAFGDLPGFVVGWSYWISVWCANAAIAVAFAGSLGTVFPATTATPARAAACALAALWLCSAINLLGLREAGRMQLLTTVLKLIPLLLFGAIALWFADARHFTPFNPTDAGLPQVAHATAALTLWALLGLEAATVPADAIENAERTVPRATVLGTLIAGITTVLACTAVLGVLPAETLAASQAPMAEAASALWGPKAGLALALVMAVSCLGALNGWVLVSGQLPLAAARDGLFPQVFTRLSRHGTPVAGILASSALATALILSNYSRSLVQVFTFVILLSTAATLVPYVAGSLAWLWRGSGHGSRTVAALALLFSLYALAGIGAEAMRWGTVLIGAGVPLYYLRRWLMRRRMRSA
ncbi:amino acid permease [Pseudoxanthomonas wuyuanensis]|uniref:Arginine/agmatine antiporter n=1 Tax=Pseudoxanthomonas wuyuanensis TaxID=1073196 RepID=A0A286DEB3_9GAMM|nr:amino acid permease [Pseudoxanthomonas wuyuanensis]KAF1720062.1 amino acid permease [Pseudoxanthomonas wuyuanensis]SOD56990.1 amino acid/polyamine/organocation transporter, APC superfamily [Pseudoxanthomonas wuyuanensis]